MSKVNGSAKKSSGEKCRGGELESTTGEENEGAQQGRRAREHNRGGEQESTTGEGGSCCSDLLVFRSIKSDNLQIVDHSCLSGKGVAICDVVDCSSGHFFLVVRQGMFCYG